MSVARSERTEISTFRTPPVTVWDSWIDNAVWHGTGQTTLLLQRRSIQHSKTIKHHTISKLHDAWTSHDFLYNRMVNNAANVRTSGATAVYNGCTLLVLYIKWQRHNLLITLHGQCSRRHVVRQQVVSDVSVVRSCGSIHSLCSESNDHFYSTKMPDSAKSRDRREDRHIHAKNYISLLLLLFIAVLVPCLQAITDTDILERYLSPFLFTNSFSWFCWRYGQVSKSWHL